MCFGAYWPELGKGAMTEQREPYTVTTPPLNAAQLADIAWWADYTRHAQPDYSKLVQRLLAEHAALVHRVFDLERRLAGQRELTGELIRLDVRHRLDGGSTDHAGTS